MRFCHHTTAFLPYSHGMARSLLDRNLTPKVQEALGDTRVVSVVGPRQAGKTTLVKQLQRRDPDATFVTLDDDPVREAAKQDPRAFVEGRPGMLVIDEVQRAPDLMLAIKASVDRDPRPGRFLLTGSTNLFAVRQIADFLAGRMESLQLHPLSQGEIEGRQERFIDAVLEGEVGIGMRVDLSKRDYLNRACAGGFPEPLLRTARQRRQRWFTSYVREVTAREVRDVAELSRIGELPRLMRLIGARHTSVLNVADLARDARMPERTVHRYLDVLEAVFLIQRLPAWAANLTSREARQSKVIIVDSGLAAHLRGASPEPLVRPEVARGADGPILEGFVVGELTRQIGWSDSSLSLHHYRDRTGIEVDIVIEAYDGRVVAIEVKSAATVAADDFQHLALVRDRLGVRFRTGLVLYAGEHGLSFGERLAALPIAALWRHPSQERVPTTRAVRPR